LEDSEATRISPLSTALLVKNPAGVIVRIDGDLLPHPEHKTVNVVAVKDGTAVLCAHLDESVDGSSLCSDTSAASIRVETKAKSIPIAMLDTRNAVFPEGGTPPPAQQRRVVLHRVGGDDGSTAGPACACIMPGYSGQFLVQYLMGEPGVALTVHTRPKVGGGKGRVIDYVVDMQGQVIAKSDGAMAQESVWVRQGVDMALMSCVVIAVKKLGS